MRYTIEQRKQIIESFLVWCGKVGYTDPEEPVRVEIVDGLPISVKRPVQSIRFDKDLTSNVQNTTME